MEARLPIGELAEEIDAHRARLALHISRPDGARAIARHVLVRLRESVAGRQRVSTTPQPRGSPLSSIANGRWA